MNILNQKKKNLIVFTDLDGTLLDHDTYSFNEARPALDRLRQLDVPVIPSTSKTFSEVEILLRDLNMMSPVIVENGSVIAVPATEEFSHYQPQYQMGDFNVTHLSVDYPFVINSLVDFRNKFGFKFRGFNDMNVAEIAKITGLTIENSANAKKRMCSEPLIWTDSDRNFDLFKQTLKNHHLRIIQGGRFWHVMGEASKSDAMKNIVDIYQRNVGQKLTVIALGDNANDVSMLKSADIGVIIRRKDRSCLSFESNNQIYTSNLSGPAGWNAFFMHFLDNDLNDSNKT